MAIHLHAFIIETNGASYVHVGRKETCALYILNYRTVDLCWQRTVSNEAFQYRTIFKYIILYWAFQVRHHPKCRYKTRRPIFFIVDTISLPNIENVNFLNTG